MIFFLRVKFFSSIKGSWIKEQMLQSELKKFNDIFNNPIVFETSITEVCQLKTQSLNITTSTENINKLTKRHH